MPNKDPEIARQLKHEWYVKNRTAYKNKSVKDGPKKKPPKPRNLYAHHPHRSSEPKSRSRTAKLPEIQGQSPSPSLDSQSRLLPPQQGQDCPAATEPACPSQTGQGKPVSKVTCLGSSVRGTMAGADSEAKKTRTAKTLPGPTKSSRRRPRQSQSPQPPKLPTPDGTPESQRSIRAFQSQENGGRVEAIPGNDQGSPREKRKRKNLLCQKNWLDKMKVEGTYKEYQARLNAHQRAQVAAKRRAMGPEVNRALQREHYVKRRNRERLKKDLAFRKEVEPHLA